MKTVSYYFVLIFFILLGSRAFSQKLNVELSKNYLNFQSSDSLIYKFYLDKSTTTSIRFVNVYGGEAFVFEKNKIRRRGWHEVMLHADSLKASNPSSGVYYLEVIGKKNESIHEFNSFHKPWGQTVDVSDLKLNNETGEISYMLPKTCFVKARVGFENGSFVKTLLGLVPQMKGQNMVFWDGKDQSNKVNIESELNPVAQIIAYALPSTAFYLFNPNHLVDYSLEEAYPDKWSKYALNPYAKIGWKTKLGFSLDYDVSANPDTTLTFSFPDQNADFVGVFNPENEIYISVDNEFIVENPNILVPGNYTIAFPKLQKGKHTVIVNIILPENRIATGTSEFFID